MIDPYLVWLYAKAAAVVGGVLAVSALGWLGLFYLGRTLYQVVGIE